MKFLGLFSLFSEFINAAEKIIDMIKKIRKEKYKKEMNRTIQQLYRNGFFPHIGEVKKKIINSL